MGYASPTAGLAHELMHGYNDIYDHDNYIARRNDTSTRGKIISTEGYDFSFTNAEEKHVTTLANQANEKLYCSITSVEFLGDCRHHVSQFLTKIYQIDI